jgi:hypothetical protein
MAISSLEELNAVMRGLSSVSSFGGMEQQGAPVNARKITQHEKERSEIILVLNNVGRIDSRSLSAEFITFIESLSENEVADLAALYVRMRGFFCEPMGVRPSQFIRNSSASSSNVEFFLEKVVDGLQGYVNQGK